MYAPHSIAALLGEVEELWDMVAIAEYPSRAAMMANGTSDDSTAARSPSR